MKRMIGAIVMLSVMTVFASPSFSQQEDQFENEFKNFREKLETARSANNAASATPAATSGATTTTTTTTTTAPADPLAATQPSNVAPASPLVVPIDGATTSTTTTTTKANNPLASQVDALANALSNASSSSNAPANPLGPAANLPLSGNNAVNTSMPSAQSPAEMQALMEEEAAQQQKKLEEATFQAAIRQLLPMSNEQIRRTYEAFKNSREAAETPVAMPEPKQVVETVSLDPADAPAIVRTAPGYVTTVIFLDSTGSPWPIQDISWAGKFTISAPESGGHVLRITPQSAHGVGNASIRMVDLIAPITLQLRTGIEEVYFRMDARIPKAGPLAKTPLIEYGGLSATAGKDNAMIGVLDGTPPAGAERLGIKGVDGRTNAWRVNDKIYLRTPLTLLSPGWEASAASADGTNVYTFTSTPVMLLSDDGRMVRAQIGDYTDHTGDNGVMTP